ncbi:transcriptional regulator, LysR family [Ectothiorhodospira mobilis]|uniref:Transcriptional regulator, LysR family n=1 Tax=Ectothiorhodospira mobilis TaxID=195064 RepID=A0A1I4SQL3_ECTMO|nr:LysR family transcriptional regulator [Ectothiorhodospira mobilis]SFM66722.1 transcriptional regulator, LysR family [Ectothiorhodospira mobilis]
MTPENLKAFITVAATGSFSAAAQQLHLTQPAVSKRVAALETALDRRLFDRIGRRVHLTEAGRVLLPRARQVMDAMDEARRLLDTLSGRVEGPLLLATSHHIGLWRLPPVLQAFAARHPAVELDLRFMDSEEACRAAEQGAVDLAVVTLPSPPSPLLTARQVWDDPLVLLTAPDHPLASGAVDTARLGQYPALLPPAGTFTRGLVDTAFARHGIRPPRVLETHYLESLRMMIRIGLGWGILPRSMAQGLHTLDWPGLGLRRALGWVAHRDRTRSNAASALIHMLEHASGDAQHDLGTPGAGNGPWGPADPPSRGDPGLSPGNGTDKR